MSIFLLLFASAGYAFEQNNVYNYHFNQYCGALSHPGSQAGYYMFAVDGNFTTAERAAIEAGIDTWTSGAGTVNRGANFKYVQIGTRSSQSLTNAFSEVWHMPHQTGIDDFALPDNWVAFGPLRADVGCLAIETFDLVLAREVDFVSLPPSATVWDNGSWDTNEYNLTAVAAHESGHNLGLGHVEGTGAIMTKNQFAQHGNELRLGEDDYSAIRYLKPDSSTGSNFMVTKWRNPSARTRVELWTSAESDSRWLGGACGVVSLLDGPKKINAVVNGTASHSGVPMEWTLSSDIICFDGDDITIGTRSPGLSSNTPYPVGPSGDEYVIPTNTPDGDYWVCAGINPDHTLTEAENSFNDNTVISEGKWSIDCP